MYLERPNLVDLNIETLITYFLNLIIETLIRNDVTNRSTYSLELVGATFAVYNGGLMYSAVTVLINDD